MEIKTDLFLGENNSRLGFVWGREKLGFYNLDRKLAWFMWGAEFHLVLVCESK